jgi:hypothetical protein
MIEYFSKINYSFLGLLLLIGILQPSYSQTKSDFPKDGLWTYDWLYGDARSSNLDAVENSSSNF